MNKPTRSPWGEIQECDTLCPGVYMVSTSGHGGTMIAQEMIAVLSPAARQCGFKLGSYLCYEEDTHEDIVIRELLDKKLWNIPDRVKDKAAWEERLNESIRNYHPDYWRSRQMRIEKDSAKTTKIHTNHENIR